MRRPINKQSKKIYIFVFIVILLIVFILIKKRYIEPYTNDDSIVCNDNRIWLFEQPYPTYNNLNNGYIFVSIASYRDSECSQTIKSLFSNAKYPNKIFVGVCEQNKVGHPEESCLYNLNEMSETNSSENDNIINTQEPFNMDLYKNNIRIINLDYTSAKGPTFARYFCSTLWKGEQYYFQIDSHTKFEKNWDETLIKMFNQCKQETEKPVISCYPASEEQMKLDGVPIMDSFKIGSNGLPIFFAGFKYNVDTNKPLKNVKPIVGANFLFLESNFLYDVPFDPFLSMLFQGEETLLSARLYTNGYVSYAPNQKIASHYYNRTGPLYHKEVNNFDYCIKRAELRAKCILGVMSEDQVPAEYKRSIEKYGMGNVRPLSDFWKESGIYLS